MKICPFCGSFRIHTAKGFDSVGGGTFLPRDGCLSCGRWFSPVILIGGAGGVFTEDLHNYRKRNRINDD